MNLSSQRDEFKYQCRVEFEVNPHWITQAGIKIKNRNRIEVRKIEDGNSDDTRLRHMWNFEIPMKGSTSLQSLYFNNEFFYDFEKNSYNENRMVPLGLKWRLQENILMQIFWLIQTRKDTSDWSSNQILGTQLAITF